MTRDIVLLPTFNRAELLQVCLEHLGRCEGIENHEVWVSEDQVGGKSKIIQQEIDEVLERATDFLNFKHIRQPKHSGPSWVNIFRCLHEAHETNCRYIYMLEDDIVVSPDFFRWSHQAHEQFRPFVTCANNDWTLASSDPLAVCLSHSDFEPWAACIARENLKRVLRADGVYERHAEEVIQNFIIKEKLDVVFPLMPRAQNIGRSHGTNQEVQTIPGDLATKTQVVRSVIRLTDPGAWSGAFTVVADHRERWERAYAAQSVWGF